MPLDTEREERGRRAYYAGDAAESGVERHYKERGLTAIARRWRGRGGEIDLIFGNGSERIFVEVKKSSTFARAADRISPKQSRRLLAAAQEYLANEPCGLLTDARFDVALVNCSGEVRVLENALTTG